MARGWPGAGREHESVRQPTARVRVTQFFTALAARRDPPDDEPARRILPSNLYALFQRMPPEDRQHGLEMLRLVSACGEPDPTLQQAALLHDVGKAEAGVGLSHRILRVLLAHHVGWLWRWLTADATGWRQPFWVVANHPSRGADWVAASGGGADLADLIRHHEAPAPAEWAGTPLAEWHTALAAADVRC
jgi:hypothetical protein